MHTPAESNFQALIIEVAELNKRLLLLQIETLENEILPCEKDIAMQKYNNKTSCSESFLAFLANISRKLRLLGSLKAELQKTSRLTNS